MDEAARRLFNLLRERDEQIVFAESCTAGLISATLGRLPSVSNVLCGSAVVYQIPTKAAWLNISEERIAEHGVVSREIAQDMAAQVLKRTPQASMAASVTGHLGPGAPPELDGIAWSSIAIRNDDSDDIRCFARQLILERPTDDSSPDATSGEELRHRRQVEATTRVLLFCCDVLEGQCIE